MGLEEDEAALASAGVLSTVEKAREELDSRIDKAVIPLLPLGVTAGDLRLLVIGKLARSK